MSKRGRRGTGWLFERDGIWHAGFKWQGRRYRWSSGSRRKTDAADMLDQKIREILSGEYKPKAARRGDTVRAVVERWLDVYVRVARNAKGAKLTRQRADNYLLRFMGNTPAADVTKDTLRRFRAWLEALTDPDTKARKLGDTSVKHILSDARCVFLWALDSGLIDRSPLPRRMMPKLEEAAPRALSPEDQARASAAPEPYGLCVRLLLASGARWSELCRATTADIQGGELVIAGPTKSKKMRRVPLPPALLAELRTRVGKLVPFGSKDNSWVNRAVRDHSGVEAFSAHRCRHSFGFNYMAAGGNLLVLRELMGHSTVELTARYAKPTAALVREDARRVMERAAGA